MQNFENETVGAGLFNLIILCFFKRSTWFFTFNTREKKRRLFKNLVFKFCKRNCNCFFGYNGPGGPFLESPDNFLGPKSCFIFAVFAFKIKVSIILKMIQWNYQLMKQNWPVSELGTVLLFNRLWFQNLPSGPKSYRDFRDTGPTRKPNKLFCQKIPQTKRLLKEKTVHCSEHSKGLTSEQKPRIRSSKRQI